MHPVKTKYYPLALGTLLMFQIGLCFLFSTRHQVISRDSLIFIAMAKSATQGEWEAFFATGHHPLYPLFIAMTHSFFEEKTEKSFMWAGQILSFTAYILSGLAIYQIAAVLFSPVIGLIAYLLAIFQPYFCRESGDVLTDLPYLAFFLWGFYALYVGFLQKRVVPFFFAGLCSACAYLIRPEGLLLPTFFLFWIHILLGGMLQKRAPQSIGSLIFYLLMIVGGIGFCREAYLWFSPSILLIPFLFVLLGIGFGWIGYLWVQPSFLWCSQWSRKTFLIAVFLFSIAFLPPSLGYMYKIGGISLKQRNLVDRLVQFLKKADPGLALNYKPDPEVHKQAAEVQNTPIPDFQFISTQSKTDSLFFTFLETAHPYLSLLFLGVFAYRIQQTFYFWSQKKVAPYSGEILLYVVFALNWLVLWSVNQSAGYIARRHNFSIIAFSLPYSAYAIYWMAQILYQKSPYYFSAFPLVQWTLQSPKRIQVYKKILFFGKKVSFGGCLVVLLLLSTFILTMKGLKPIEPGHFYLRQLSTFMRETYGPEKIQMGNLPRVAFYADGKNVPFTKPVGENGLTDLKNRNVDFILIKDDFLTTGTYEVVVAGQYRLIQFWLKKQWIEPVPLPESVVDPKNKVLLFRVLKQNLPQ